MVLFDVANMLFVLVVRMIAVPSVSVPLIFAGQLFMLSLYVIRPPPCADLRLIHIIAVVILVSCCRVFLVSRLRVTIVTLRIRQLTFWILVIKVHCSTFARLLASISFRDALLSIHCDYLANAIRR